MWARRACLLVAAALLTASCGGATDTYLVPRDDQHVLDDTYNRMLTALERSKSNDPGFIPDGATPGERMLYVMFFVDDEIANGGLYQAYWNLPGGFVQEAVRDADLIGAHQWASLVRQAGE